MAQHTLYEAQHGRSLLVRVCEWVGLLLAEWLNNQPETEATSIDGADRGVRDAR